MTEGTLCQNGSLGMTKLVVACLLCASFSVSSADAFSGATIRDFFEACRASGASVTIGLADGALRTGLVTRVRKADLYFREGSTRNEEGISYTDVVAVIDPVTGDRFAVSQVPPGHAAGSRASLKVLLWIGVAVGGLLILVFATGLNRA